MSDCLTRLIGLDGCTEGTEPFKLNQIGYSLGQVSEFMDDSFQNVDDFFQSCVKTAVAQIESDALNYLPTPREGITMLENRTIGMESEVRKVQTQAGYVGVRIELANATDFVKVNLSRIRLYANFTGEREIKVIDVNTGQEVESVTVEAEAGKIIEVPISISKSAARNKLTLFVGYDSEGEPSYLTQTTSSCMSCGGYQANVRRSAFLTFGGAQIEAPFTRNTLSSISHTGGIMVDYTIECDTAAYLCTVSGLIGLPLLYKTAMVILEYGLRSGGQFSEQKTINSENNQERYMHASAEYDRYLIQNLGKAKVSTTRCFYCAPRIGIQNRLPA